MKRSIHTSAIDEINMLHFAIARIPLIETINTIQSYTKQYYRLLNGQAKYMKPSAQLRTLHENLLELSKNDHILVKNFNHKIVRLMLDDS